MFWFTVLLVIVACSCTQAVHKLCYEDYPELSGLLCYKKCRTNFYGVGPVCWAYCPSSTTDIGALCVKHTYGRGVGTPLHACRSGEERGGLLCYPKCASGYYGVAFLCWKNCDAGYTDDGLTCRKNAHVVNRNVDSCPWHDKCGLCGGPWYNVCGRRRNCGGSCPSGYRNDGCTCWRNVHIYWKSSYNRGIGKVMTCSSNQEQDAGLCYSYCRHGYYGVGPLCWASCSGETRDTGTQCQKNTYGRGVGKVINCLKMPDCNDIGDCAGLQSEFTKLDGIQSFQGAACQLMYFQIKGWITIIQTFNSCYKNDQWGTLSISYSAGAAVGFTISGEIGVAIDADANEGICFLGWCNGFKTDISIGAEFVIGWWKSLDSVPGKSVVVGVGVDIPGTELGIGVAFVTSADTGDYIGTTFGVGIGVGIMPVEISVLNCDTPQSTVVEFTP